MNLTETNDFRAEAEKHCAYTEKVLSFTKEPMTEREKYLYVAAMVHGHKHGKQGT